MLDWCRAKPLERVRINSEKGCHNLCARKVKISFLKKDIPTTRDTSDKSYSFWSMGVSFTAQQTPPPRVTLLRGKLWARGFAALSHLRQMLLIGFSRWGNQGSMGFRSMLKAAKLRCALCSSASLEAHSLATVLPLTSFWIFIFPKHNLKLLLHLAFHGPNPNL